MADHPPSTRDLLATLLGDEIATRFYRGSLVELFLDDELPWTAWRELHAAREIVRRWMLEEMRHGPLLNDQGAVADYLRVHLRGKEREVFTVLLLDHHHRLLAAEDLFLGSIDGVEVRAREVLRSALHENASAVIVAHNHPSGDAQASEADLALTERLRDALALLDIRLLDHLIVGGARVRSVGGA
jgi:DNA repair protein RadC